MSQYTVFSMTPEQAEKAYGEYGSLCAALNDEYNAKEVRELAKKMGIQVTGKNKKDLCMEIATTINLFRDSPARAGVSPKQYYSAYDVYDDE